LAGGPEDLRRSALVAGTARVTVIHSIALRLRSVRSSSANTFARFFAALAAGMAGALAGDLGKDRIEQTPSK
jgi:hypothetical protein